MEEKRVRQFGYLGFVLFGLIAALFAWRGRDVRAVVSAALSVFFLAGTLVSPRLMTIVYRGWMAVVGVIGWVNRQILLTLVFFLVVTPFALVLRLIGRDYMSRRFDPSAASYWEPMDEVSSDPGRYERRF